MVEIAADRRFRSSSDLEPLLDQKHDLRRQAEGLVLQSSKSPFLAPCRNFVIVKSSFLCLSSSHFLWSMLTPCLLFCVTLPELSRFSSSPLLPTVNEFCSCPRFSFASVLALVPLPRTLQHLPLPGKWWSLHQSLVPMRLGQPPLFRGLLTILA
jgi:hypothetical protein